MTRYVLYLLVYLVVYVVAMLIAPLLVLFGRMEEGLCDNANKTLTEPRLPRWLYWFSTNEDNSLWGDTGWRTMHCPKYWGAYWGMVGWLWRNAACGFGWSVIAHRVSAGETFTVETSEECDLSLDKSQWRTGWYKIRSSSGAFQFRWVRVVNGRYRFDFEAGWLLDPYVRNMESAMREHPRATFMFQPGFRRKK